MVESAAIAAFRSHREGFRREGAGDLRGAEKAYIAAARSLAALLSDETFATWVEGRAALQPEQMVSKQELAATLRACLPDWVLGVHLGRCASEFGRDLIRASMHWQVILASGDLGMRSYSHSIDACRLWLEIRYFKLSSEDERTRRLQAEVGERIVRLDPHNLSVRNKLVVEYVEQLQRLLRSMGKTERVDGVALPRVRSGLKSPGRALRTAALLKRHSRKLERLEPDPIQRKPAVVAYETLAAIYLHEGDRDDALRFRRRSKRLRRAETNDAAIAERWAPLGGNEGPRPPSLDRNPFADLVDPYEEIPFEVLGVPVTANNLLIAQASRRPAVKRTGEAPGLTLEKARRLLEIPVMRLAYDIMLLAKGVHHEHQNRH